LDPAAVVADGNSLVLDDSFLAAFGSASSVGLLSYSSIDLHGSGTFGSSSLSNLTLGAGEIRGLGQGDGPARILAQDVLLRNPNAANPTAPDTDTASGTLEISAETIRLGTNDTAIRRYTDVRLTATRGVLGEGTGGLSAQANL